MILRGAAPNFPISTQNVFWCDNCHELPLLSIDDQNNISIKCSCYSDKNLSLSAFFQEIEELKNSLPLCSQHDPNDEIKSDYFCLDCNQNYCQQCFITHQGKLRNQHRFVSAGIQFPLECQNPLCHSMNKKPSFYCLKCRKFFCQDKGCKDKHKGTWHKSVNLKEFCMESKAERFKKALEELKKEIEADFLLVDDLVNSLTNIIKSFTKEIQRIKKENEKRIQFFDSLYSSYVISKDIPNYSTIQNLVSNSNLGNFHRTEIQTKVDELKEAFDERLTFFENNLSQIKSVNKVRPKETLPYKDMEINTIVVSKEGKIYAGYNNQYIYVFSLVNGQYTEESSIEAFEETVDYLYECQRDNSIACISYEEGLIKFLNKDSHQFICGFDPEMDTFDVLETSNKDLILFSTDSIMKIYDEDYAFKREINHGKERIIAAIEVKNNHIVTKENSGILYLWNLNNYSLRKELIIEEYGTNVKNNMIYLPESNNLIVGMESGDIAIVDMENFEISSKVASEILEGCMIIKLTQLKNGYFIAGLGNRRGIAVMDYDFTLIDTFHHQGDIVGDTYINGIYPIGYDKFLTSSSEGNINIWEY